MGRTQRSSSNVLAVALKGIGLPLALGLAACVGFYSLVHAGWISHPLVTRYFAGHPVEYFEAAMFFIGLAALAIRLVWILLQMAARSDVRLSPAESSGDKPARATELCESLRKLPRHIRQSYVAERLQNALQHVARKESADHLDDELKYLADIDAGRQHEGYALVRIIVWATPMLGFLGTVIGITLALGDLSPEALVNSPEQAMQGLLAGLSVAFDTTALALSLSIILMFGQFLTNQLETDLLAAVERHANSELVGRFIEYGSRTDPQLASVRRMTETVLDTARELVHSQTELWQNTIETTHEQLQQTATQAHEALQSGMQTALTEAAKAHAAELSRSEQTVRRESEKSQQALLGALSQNARVLQHQQSELAKQGDMILQMVRGTNEISRLEKSLNQNLQSVASARSLPETIQRLALAIEQIERQRRSATSSDLDAKTAAIAASEERAA